MNRPVATVAAVLAAAVIGSMATAQQPVALVAAVGSNMNHVPSFVGVEKEELNGIAQATGKTILFVTHNVEEAVFLGDRCCVLSRRPGRVKALVSIGVPRERRTWKLFTSDAAFTATKDRVLALVREEVGAEDERR